METNEQSGQDSIRKASSFTVAHQQHQFTYSFCLSTFLWFTFFTPLAARYHVENAFGLPYVGVHALCLYAGLLIFAIAAYPIYFWIWKSGDEGNVGRN